MMINKRLFCTRVLSLVTLALLTCAMLACVCACSWLQKLYPNNPSDPNHSNGQPQQQPTVQLFFSQSQGNQSVVRPVSRPVNTTVSSLPVNQQVQMALSQLLLGPNPTETTQGFYSEIPKGTRLLGMTLADNKITVNLSEAFGSGGGSNSMTQRLAELQETLKALKLSQAVYLQVEGKPLEVLGGEGVPVNQPLNQPVNQILPEPSPAEPYKTQ